MKVLIPLFAILAAAQAVAFYEIVKEEWEVFKMKHNKTYSPIEEKFRLKVFAENKHKIAKHNARHLRGETKYNLAMNEYGDMLHHEFVQTMNGYRQPLKAAKKLENRPATFIAPANVKLPESIDWREYGAVTPVKNQGQCGSCWSFSATGSLEGQHFRRTGTLVSLSEQNLIDCSVNYGNNGCNGGLMDQAFQYIKDNKGIDTEFTYPYEAEDDACRYNPVNSGATDVGYVDILSGNEEQLKAAVATVGPVSVAIDASHESFQFYNGGIYYERECSSYSLDHGVLVVGYGVDQKGWDYWLVKNSWGPSWGDNGYLKMARNQGNNCGIASSASYPLV